MCGSYHQFLANSAVRRIDKQQYPPGYLERLPVEISLLIVGKVSDAQSLFNLICK